jgi:hypothetical protein
MTLLGSFHSLSVTTSTLNCNIRNPFLSLVYYPHSSPHSPFTLLWGDAQAPACIWKGSLQQLQLISEGYSQPEASPSLAWSAQVLIFHSEHGTQHLLKDYILKYIRRRFRVDVYRPGIFVLNFTSHFCNCVCVYMCLCIHTHMWRCMCRQKWTLGRKCLLQSYFFETQSLTDSGAY